MKFFYLMVASTLAMVSLSTCDKMFGSSSSTYTANITMLSKSLATGSAIRTARKGTDLHTNTCASGKKCVTPTNLEGRIYYGGLMVGGNGPSSGSGPNGYSLTTIAANDDVRQRPDLGKGGTTTFNLSTATDISGKYFCCGGPGLPSDQTVYRLEFGFDYLDATFKVPSDQGGSLANKTYTIRIVYVTSGTVTDIVSGTETTIQQWDKLVKGPSETTFKWCDASECTSTTRPSSPVQDGAKTAYSQPKEGNQDYVSFPVKLISSFAFPQADIEKGNWRFKVDFSLSNAVIFNVSAWTSITSVRDLVDKFQLVADPGGSEGIYVDLTKEAL